MAQVAGDPRRIAAVPRGSRLRARENSRGERPDGNGVLQAGVISTAILTSCRNFRNVRKKQGPSRWMAIPAPLERSAAVSKTSRSAWEVRRRRELAACCGWSRTTQPRSIPGSLDDVREQPLAESPPKLFAHVIK